ncbi:MAG: CPBP family intramembrane metalloprotease [Bacteroidales bacterium]|jgi:membrane protease YdiL (CAAX protease family)
MNENILKALFANARPCTKLVFALFIVLTSYVLVSTVTILIVVLVLPLSFEELNAILREGLVDADVSLIRIFQISQSLGLFIIPSVLLNFLLFHRGKGFISKDMHNSVYAHWIVLFTLIFSVPLVSYLIDLNNSLNLPQWLSLAEDKLQQMEYERNLLTERMTGNMQLADYLFNLLMIAVLPAIGEEFLFRGILQKLLFQWIRNSHLSILIAAILFSSIHLQFYGFLPRMVLGMYFGYLFFWSKNIWMAVWAHFLNNTIAISLILISENSWINAEIFSPENHADTFTELVLSGMVTTVLLLITYQHFRKKSGSF